MAIGRIPEPGTGIPESIIAAKGDLIVGTANDTPGILSVGTNGYTLVADSSVSPTGLKWAIDPTTDVVTTAGDLIYGTAADTVTRLGIGTAGQVLKVNSGATAPEWGAASAGLTKITSSSFSAAATVSVNDCFSATYDHYRIIIEAAASAAQDIAQRWRVSGSDNTSAIYDYGYVFVTGTSGPTRASANNATSNTLAYNGTGEPSYISVDVYYPFLSTRQTGYTGLSMTYEGDSSANYIGGNHNSNASFTGFTLFPKTSGTITGKVTVYGYQI